MSEWEELRGGRVTPGVVRIGATVRRPVLHDARFRHELLRHLEATGFAGSPRILGMDDEAREILTYLEGDVPADLGHYADEQLVAAAQLLRTFHNASAGFASVIAAGAEVACHNDFSPTNCVFRAGLPWAMIDFDAAGPGLRLWDVGYSAFVWLDLGNSDYTGTEQIRRLRVFGAAYNHPSCHPAAIAVHAVARQAVLASAGRAAGNSALAIWSKAACDWTCEHMLEVLQPSNQFNAQL